MEESSPPRTTPRRSRCSAARSSAPSRASICLAARSPRGSRRSANNASGRPAPPRRAPSPCRRSSDGTGTTRRGARGAATRAAFRPGRRAGPHRRAAGASLRRSPGRPSASAELILDTLVADGRPELDVISPPRCGASSPRAASTSARYETRPTASNASAGKLRIPARSGTATSATAPICSSAARRNPCASTAC